MADISISGGEIAQLKDIVKGFVGFCYVKLPSPEGGSLSAHRTALRDSHRCQVGNPSSIRGLARAFGTILRATRSDAENGVGKSKGPPSRRFKSVRRHSQERFAHLSRSLRGVLPLPRFVGQFLGFNCGALSENAVGKFAVAALTFSREAPIAVPPLGGAYLRLDRLRALAPFFHVRAASRDLA
jgi:hypothetical protein